MNIINLIHGECLDRMKTLADNSVDSIVTDPPYGLSFMGKKWDYDVPNVEVWKEALRVLKPGGHLLSFAGSRTYHRMAVNIEDAGFEIRDQIMWVYGSGFPKSHNVGKSVDKLQGNEREVVGEIRAGKTAMGQNSGWNAHENKTVMDETKGTSPYEGWGTALKPAHEPIVVARKPLSEKTIALNVLKWGTGGINIDGCRVETSQTDKDIIEKQVQGFKNTQSIGGTGKYIGGNITDRTEYNAQLGRFPANFIHDGSDEVVGLFPDSKSSNAIRHNNPHKSGSMAGATNGGESFGFSDSGSAARFFYCAKASKADRNEGLDEFEEKIRVRQGLAGEKKDTASKNSHPTVKPTKLMQYLVRLVTPKGGTVLDPFMGSGSTGKACKKENFNFVGIEMDEEYMKIAEARIVV